MEFSSTIQTVAWFRDRYADNTLILKPAYQRKAVWMARQKCWLVESVLKKVPIPELFIQRTTDQDGKSEYAVVDGQQRIRTLLQFVGADADVDQLEYDKFALDKLPPSSPWYGLTFAELEPHEKIAFYDYALAVRNLETNSDDDLKDMFRRINRFTTVLNPQEIRNATYGGPFAELATKLADEHGDFLAENRIITAAAIRRMNDVEFVAELLIGIMHGPQGGTPKIIDNYYQQYEDLEGDFPAERGARRTFARVVSEVEEFFVDLRQSRWNNKTDFYTLFVVLATLSESGQLARIDKSGLASATHEFGAEVDRLFADPDLTRSSTEAKSYLRAVIKGANDKARRAARHTALSSYLARTVDGA